MLKTLISLQKISQSAFINKSLNLRGTFAQGKKIPRPQSKDLDRDGNPISSKAADPLLTKSVDWTYNINEAENPEWFQNIKRAKERRSILEEVKDVPLLNRRQRKVFDRPRLDTSQENYVVWREYVNLFEKHQYMGYKIGAQVKLSPKWLVHAIGEGVPSFRNDSYAMKEWDFMDSNLDRFLLYDFKGSTAFWGDNIEGYDYTQDETLKRPKQRKYKHLTPDEFWASEDLFTFHVNCTHYGNAYKFTTWLENEIKRMKDESLSYEQQVVKKHGELNLYNDFNKSYQNFTEPTIFKFDRSYFEVDGKTQGKKKGTAKKEQDGKSDEYSNKVVPKTKLGEEFRLSQSTN